MPNLLRLIDRPGFIDDLETNKESPARAITFTKIANIINYLDAYCRPALPFTRWSSNKRIEDFNVVIPTDLERHSSAYGGALSNHYITVLIGVRREAFATPASSASIVLTAQSTSDAVTIYPYSATPSAGFAYSELFLPYTVTWCFASVRTTATVSEKIVVSSSQGIAIEAYAAWILPPQAGGDLRSDSLGFVPLRYETNYDSAATDPFKFNPRHFYVGETAYSNASSNATIYDLDTALSRMASNHGSAYFPRQVVLFSMGSHDTGGTNVSANWYHVNLFPDTMQNLPTEGIYLPRTWLNEDTNSTYRVCVGAVKAKVNTGTAKLRFRSNTNTSANYALDTTMKWIPMEIGGTYNTSNAGMIFRAPKAETIIYLEGSVDAGSQQIEVAQVVIWENRLDNA